MRGSTRLRLVEGGIVVLVLALSVSAIPANVSATPDVLELEAERRWTAAGDISIEELAIEDVDGGGLPEVVSVGGSGSGTGEIRVHSYTGSSFTDAVPPVYPPEYEAGVAIGDVDGNPSNPIEIVTVGGLGSTGDVSVWRVTAGALSPVGQHSIPDSELEDLAVVNLDGDSLLEIVVTGRSTAVTQALLRVLSWDGTMWTTEASTTFDAGFDTTAWAVAVGELDGSAPLEIVTVGNRGPSPSAGQVAVWHYSGGTLTKIAEYFVAGGTAQGVIFWDVAIGDPDNDLLPEVLAVGSQDWMGANPYSQVRSFRLDIPWILAPESTESRPGEFWLSVAIGDVDADGQQESVVAGQEAGPGGRWGALAVVRAVGLNFVHELDRYRWLSWTWPWSTVIGNPDGDLVFEFFTGSQRSPADNAAEIRAWNWNVPAKPDDSWPQFQRDTSHSGFSAAAAPNTNNVAWSKNSFVGGCYQHDRYSPVTYDGNVFVVVTGRLWAFALDGTSAWPSSVSVQDNLLGPTARSLAAGAGRVYYGGSASGTPSYGVLSSYRSDDGALVWTKGSETFSRQFVWAPPALTGDRIILGTAGDNAPPPAPPGQVFAFDFQGSVLWTFSTGVDVLASPAIAGTRVYVRAGTDLYSIPLDDPNGDGVISNPGEIDWKFSMGTWSGARHAVQLVGSPSVAGNFVYIGSHDGYLYKVPRTDPTPADKIISLADVTSGGGWRSQILGSWVASTAVVSQGAVYIGADFAASGHLYRLDDSSGVATWTINFYQISVSPPAVAPGKVFIMNRPTSASELYVSAYDTATSAQLWSKLVHSQSSGPSMGASVALTAGYLFTSNGFQDCSATYPAGSTGYLFAIKDP